MQDFLVHSLVASVVLTILANLIPRLFPKATQKAERQVHEKMKEAFEEREDGTRPKVRVFFPWKTMIVVSIVLTVLLNLIGLLVHR